MRTHRHPSYNIYSIWALYRLLCKKKENYYKRQYISDVMKLTLSREKISNALSFRSSVCFKLMWRVQKPITIILLFLWQVAKHRLYVRRKIFYPRTSSFVINYISRFRYIYQTNINSGWHFSRWWRNAVRTTWPDVWTRLNNNWRSR